MRTSNVRFVRTGLAVLAAVAGVIVPLLHTPTASAATSPQTAGQQCWAGSRSNHVKSGPITLFIAHYDWQWCASNGRITGFKVIRCEAGEWKQAFVHNADQDCQPRESLGGSELRIYGNIWMEPTVDGNINGVGLEPGRVNSHFEITLHPDGRLDGDTS